MKIILQPEARTISNFELARNQSDLIELLTKIKVINFSKKKPILKPNLYPRCSRF